MTAERALAILKSLTKDDVRMLARTLAGNISSKFCERVLCLCDLDGVWVPDILTQDQLKTNDNYIPLASLYDNGIVEKPFEEWDEVAQEDWAYNEVVAGIDYAIEWYTWKED